MDYVRVRSYFDEQSPLCTSEQAYILCKEDLITLKPSRENTWLDGIIEKIPQKFPSRLTRHIFCPPELREKNNPESTNLILFSPERVNIVVSFCHSSREPSAMRFLPRQLPTVLCWSYSLAMLEICRPVKKSDGHIIYGAETR
ncbi:hypothetical protein BELL_0203g00060 [Botrytis elliptica]|uniref:Uncharacterized protein n=1 Tax=Botrytis elliptica TaxID=278938 RepID=A0A4Z1JVD3_9HELO|nr:hypothetical protein BELL_0203g00060 [Botrytis elliptica]